MFCFLLLLTQFFEDTFPFSSYFYTFLRYFHTIFPFFFLLLRIHVKWAIFLISFKQNCRNFLNIKIKNFEYEEEKKEKKKKKIMKRMLDVSKSVNRIVNVIKKHSVHLPVFIVQKPMENILYYTISENKMWFEVFG